MFRLFGSLYKFRVRDIDVYSLYWVGFIDIRRSISSHRQWCPFTSREFSSQLLQHLRLTWTISRKRRMNSDAGPLSSELVTDGLLLVSFGHSSLGVTYCCPVSGPRSIPRPQTPSAASSDFPHHPAQNPKSQSLSFQFLKYHLQLSLPPRTTDLLSSDVFVRQRTPVG